jgi:outer membrane lipoprotein carrier protein
MTAWILASLLAAAAAAAPAPAQDDADGERLLASLQQRVAGLADFRARFVQTYRSGRFGGAVSESGVLYVKRPAMARWEYSKPERKTGVVTPEGETWFYLPEERQAYRGSLEGRELPLVLALLTGSRDAAEAFEVTGFRRGAEVSVITLVPREEEGIAEVLLTVGMEPLQILGVVAGDPTGARTEYVFSEIREELGMGPELFSFRPPPGVEILEEEPPDPGVEGAAE